MINSWKVKGTLTLVGLKVCKINKICWVSIRGMDQGIGNPTTPATSAHMWNIRLAAHQDADSARCFWHPGKLLSGMFRQTEELSPVGWILLAWHVCFQQRLCHVTQLSWFGRAKEQGVKKCIFSLAVSAESLSSNVRLTNRQPAYNQRKKKKKATGS